MLPAEGIQHRVLYLFLETRITGGIAWFESIVRLEVA